MPKLHFLSYELLFKLDSQKNHNLQKASLFFNVDFLFPVMKSSFPLQPFKIKYWNLKHKMMIILLLLLLLLMLFPMICHVILFILAIEFGLIIAHLLLNLQPLEVIHLI